MNSVTITGIQNSPYPETRPILLLDVEYSGSEYKWQIYYDTTASLNEFLSEEKIQSIYDDIQSKEEEWQLLTPKTRSIDDPFSDSGSISVDIDKSEIVRPDIPDYYAKRRLEYPTIGDQLDAIWHGSGSVEYNSMKDKVIAVKNKHPKPN